MKKVKATAASEANKTAMKKFQPLIIKELFLSVDIPQGDFAAAIGLSRAAVSRIINHNYAPVRSPGYRKQIERIISNNLDAMRWLKERGCKIEDIWKPLGKDLRGLAPRGTGKKIIARRSVRSMIPGDPGEYNPPLHPSQEGTSQKGNKNQEVEAEMLTGETLKHFRLFRSPFTNDIRDTADIYMSDEHRYIEAAMIDAARHGGFLAVIGEVGSGKSVIRKKVVSELQKDDNSRIIYPRMIDKTRITAASICDAIVLDLSDEGPKMRLEQKTRQVEKLLISRSKAGCHVCLMIEEAHDLSVRVLKLLKRFYEIEDGYKKAVGIILIGQPELGSLFNEADHYDMREVIRRCQVAYILGLNGNIKDYLSLKFKRVNVDLKSIINDEAIRALSSRLMDKDVRGKKISNAYPLTVNNYIVRAMNLACDMGEQMVTAAVINNL